MAIPDKVYTRFLIRAKPDPALLGEILAAFGAHRHPYYISAGTGEGEARLELHICGLRDGDVAAILEHVRGLAAVLSAAASHGVRRDIAEALSA